MAKTAFETVIETLTLDSWHKMDGMFGLNTVQHRTWSFLHLLMDICFLLCLYSNKMSDQFHHWCNWSVTFSNVLVTGLMLTCPGYSSPISFQHKLCKRSQHILPVKTEITCRTLALSQFALCPPPPPTHTHTHNKETRRKKRKEKTHLKTKKKLHMRLKH